MGAMKKEPVTLIGLLAGAVAVGLHNLVPSLGDEAIGAITVGVFLLARRFVTPYARHLAEIEKAWASAKAATASARLRKGGVAASAGGGDARGD